MKEETHTPTNTPANKNTGKMVWVVITIVLVTMLIALSVISYIKFKDLNRQVTLQKVEIAELQSTKNTLEDAAKAAASAAVSTASNATQVYKIPELGIQFKPGKDLQDLTYYVKTESNGNKYAYFTTSSLMTLASSKSGENQANEDLCYPGAIGSIGKTQASTEYTKKQIGSFYVGLARSQAYCSDNAEVIKLQNSQYDQLNSAFNSSVEAIKL